MTAKFSFSAEDVSRSHPDIFGAASYSDWVRATIRLRARHPEAIALYESTIAEPTGELGRVVGEAFAQSVTPRFVSIFAGGNPFAKAALAARYAIPAEQFITTTGTTAALTMILKSLVEPGAHVLVESPGFDLVTQLAQDAGALVEDFRRPAPRFQIDLTDLRARLRPTTRAIMLTNLHNPSGVLLDAQALKIVAELASEVGAVVVVDEVYGDFARPNGAVIGATLAPNILSASSLTKVFGLFALKFGWLAGSPDLIDRIRQRAPEGDYASSKLTHALAALILEKPEAFERHWMGLLEGTRPIVMAHAQAMAASGLIEGEIPPLGCMYYPRIVGVTDTMALARRLWRDYALLVAPGEYFGLPGHFRIGFGSDPGMLNEGLGRLHKALATIREYAD